METRKSVEARESEEWEPEWTTRRFVAIAACERCKEPVAVAGEVSVELDREAYYEQYDEVFEPDYVSPAPDIFAIDSLVPSKVRDPLRRAFRLFWSDAAGCANCIRAVVEAILTERRVSRTTVNKRSKRVVVSLHDRIIKFQSFNAALGSKMLALKWLGNAGSHFGAQMSRSDLFDGMELLQHILDELYGRKTKHLATLARRITKQRGPLSTKRSRARRARR